MLVDPISLSGMCSVIVSRSPPCRRCVPHLLRLPGPAPPHPCLSGRSTTALRCCSEFLYWIKAARLRRPARAGGLGPPPLHVSATAPAAPAHSARNPTKADNRTRKHPDHSEHQDQADAHQTRTRHNRPSLQRRVTHGVGSRVQLECHIGRRQGRMESRPVAHGGSVAETGTGLLETHVTGARSAVPPSWLTFAGSGQNPL